MNWAPTGQSVHIGFMNKENDALYLNDDVEGECYYEKKNWYCYYVWINLY